MSVQRLNEKKVRRIARETGLDVRRAWTGGDNHVVTFLAVDPTREDGHWHGWFERRTGRWGELIAPTHFDTCRERWWESE